MKKQTVNSPPDYRMLGGARRYRVNDRRHGEGWGMRSFNAAMGVPARCCGSRRCWRGYSACSTSTTKTGGAAC